ncbi:MAG: hypothetical protein E4H11_09075 [Myxococcales bacterium]|nr:MAG: hypothetical protein E4H11_09075 [Myxococcales bacterium]
MQRPRFVWISACVALAGVDAPAQEIPLQVLDSTPRQVLVRFEQSIDPAAVGQVFGASWPASWSVSAGVGRVDVSAETHGLARAAGEGLGFAPVPGSFAPIAIEIDLATLEATSEPTSGSLAGGQFFLGFATRALDTRATAGFIGPNVGALLCSSQQQIDDACPSIPFLCGLTCTLVTGAPYDPLTGTLHLVGSESKQSCDGAQCQGPIEVFATTGDLLLVEVAVGVPAASAPLRIGLALWVATLGAIALRRARA